MKSQRWIPALLLGLCASLVASVVTYTRLLEGLDTSLAEIYASYSGQTRAHSQIVMITVDDNRLNLSLLMRALSKRPPRAIVMHYDLSVSDADTAVFDIRLAEAMHYSGNVIVPLPTTKSPVAPPPQENPQSFPSMIPYFVNVTGTLNGLPPIQIKNSPSEIFLRSALFCAEEPEQTEPLRGHLLYNLQNRAVADPALQTLILTDRILERLVRIRTGFQIDWIALEKTRRIPIDDQGGFFLKRFPQDYLFQSVAYDMIMEEYNRAGEYGGETPHLDSLMEKIVIVSAPTESSRQKALKTGAVLSSLLNMDYILEKRGWTVYFAGFLAGMGLAFALLYFPTETHSIPLFCLLFLIAVGYFLFRMGFFMPLSGIFAGSISIYLSCVMLRKEISSGRIDRIF